jgi:glutamine amidotransferase
VIAVVDYGAGNVRSVTNALANLGHHATVTSDPDRVLGAKAVVFPGVGAAGDTMRRLSESGLAEAIRRRVAGGGPVFAVCIGMQVLFSGTEEGGWHECLGIIPGMVTKLPPGLKVPQIGWNQVKQKISHPIFAGIPDESYFYFVHSYYARPENGTTVAGTTEYGVSLCSVFIDGTLVGTQFHPEKSGELGLRMYANFLSMAGIG